VYGKTNPPCRFQCDPKRARTFFVTTKTSMGRPLLQSERNAMLSIEVLRSYVTARKFRVHDFVVMPDHVHLLLTVGSDMTIEPEFRN